VTTAERVSLEPAFVLHGRAYRETSELLEVFSREHGRVSLVARGMRRPKSGLRALLQPFRPLLLSWSGRGGGLMTLGAAEPAGGAIDLAGDGLMSGFYANELLLRFLHRGDPHPQLFATYAQVLGQLGAGAAAAAVLRGFELELLAESGYGLNLDHDAVSGLPLDPEARYQYVVERGPVAAGEDAGDVATYRGADLLAIGRGEFHGEPQLQSARRLLRAVLDHHLGGQPLKTRQVVRAMRR
jgi:DNA repair protein RecO (recombination protein O)